MRVVLAYDGSAGAEIAATLVESLPWPDGAAIRVVAAREPTDLAPTLAFGSIAGPPSPEIDRAITGYLTDEVARVVDRLRSAGLHAEGHVIVGRPATILAEDAASFGADLVVMGSRGHGALATLVLGSVSAEVVDQASCPVLVARRGSAERILLATDGSPAAAHAEQVVRWPAFAPASVRVVSVVDVPRAWHSGVAPTMQHAVLDAYADDLENARARATALVDTAVASLADAGRSADGAVRTGDSAAEIVAEADAWDADLVVVGSRGLTGLARIVLGSVARNVLQGTRSSVLVVRDRQRPSPATNR